MAGCWTPALEPATVQALCEYGEVRKIPRGEVLLFTGTKAYEAYLLRSGTVRIWCDSPDGPRVLRVAGTADMVGLAGLFHGKPQCATAEAATDLDVVVFTLDSIRQVMADRRDLRLPLLSILTEEADVRRERLNCVWLGGNGCAISH